MKEVLRILTSGTGAVVLKTVLSAIVLWILFTMISMRALVAAWEQASWPLVAAALAFVPVHIGIRAYRWRRLLQDADEPQESARAVRTVLVGYAFAVSTPAEVGDVAARIRLHDGTARSKILALVVVEKALHSALILLPGLPAIALYLWGDQTVAWLIAGTAAVFLLSVVSFAPRLGSVSFDTDRPNLGSLARVLRAMGSVRRKTFIALTISTMGIFLVYVVQEYLLMNALTELDIVGVWNGFWAGMGVRTLAPFFVMDLGIREATHVVFFGRYGIDASSAMAVSLLMFGLNIVLPSVVGLAVMFRKGQDAA